ncbi:hypothetical protein GCM10027052_11200 [Parafrigoribacterium mesophilum]|uniref:amidohydrolase family protein n=1 Tax=Parafrigoribacterium mesophilum TaxID=433646 RepID=UPI0031FD23AF
MSLLLHNARMLGGRRTDLRVVDGTIAAIGPSLPFESSEVVDLDGRFVLPGLWDNHVHFTQHALAAQRLDVSAASSAAQVAGIMAEAATAANAANAARSLESASTTDSGRMRRPGHCWTPGREVSPSSSSARTCTAAG